MSCVEIPTMTREPFERATYQALKFRRGTQTTPLTGRYNYAHGMNHAYVCFIPGTHVLCIIFFDICWPLPKWVGSWVRIREALGILGGQDSSKDKQKYRITTIACTLLHKQSKLQWCGIYWLSSCLSCPSEWSQEPSRCWSQPSFPLVVVTTWLYSLVPLYFLLPAVLCLQPALGSGILLPAPAARYEACHMSIALQSYTNIVGQEVRFLFSLSCMITKSTL